MLLLSAEGQINERFIKDEKIIIWKQARTHTPSNKIVRLFLTSQLQVLRLGLLLWQT